jgi:tagaturonate reductase
MKVRVLNGAHTAMVPIGIMLGLETVREVMDHPRAARFIEDLVFREILPTLDLPEDERESFAADVLDRFRNPFIQHRLSSIALNSLSKFKVRLLPSLLQYQFRYRQVPERMVVVFAALLRFYKGEWRGQPIPLADDPAQVAWLQGLWRDYLIPDLIPQVLQNQAVWGLDLSRINGLPERLRDVLSQLEETGFDGLIE